MKSLHVARWLTIDPVKIVVLSDGDVQYRLPHAFSGEAMEEWKRSNSVTIRAFFKSLPDELQSQIIIKRITTKTIKSVEKQLNYYQPKS